ncbi:hypothetical protein L596_004066 [Steinernema carpocapsae]|uniref:Apple domain-containing protein n=1 Tax=Steinernema carpocapsae TaxID=34508 RepID=A0A4U8UUP4_STECR|nr:hypothetical protein L596_004066 [Steinernema carpocapsae]
MKFQSALFFLCSLSVSLVEATTFATECFLPTYHRGISNSPPIAELWKVTPYDCLTYCVVNAAKMGNTCRSVVYHRHFSTCQLYSHDGTANGSQVVYASGHDYYNRTSFENLCQDRKAIKHNSGGGAPAYNVNSNGLRYAPPKRRHYPQNANLFAITDPTEKPELQAEVSTTTPPSVAVEGTTEMAEEEAENEMPTTISPKAAATPTAMFFNPSSLLCNDLFSLCKDRSWILLAATVRSCDGRKRKGGGRGGPRGLFELLYTEHRL